MEARRSYIQQGSRVEVRVEARSLWSEADATEVSRSSLEATQIQSWEVRSLTRSWER